jgi:hypothetical protein
MKTIFVISALVLCTACSEKEQAAIGAAFWGASAALAVQ